jgi:uncharacterized DUF497 family protein
MVLYIQEDNPIVRLEWDEAKRASTIVARSLDFADAALLFRSGVMVREDARRDYGERRFVAVGHLRNAVVSFVFTERGSTENSNTSVRRIISMRRATRKEVNAYVTTLRAVSPR